MKLGDSQIESTSRHPALAGPYGRSAIEAPGHPQPVCAATNRGLRRSKGYPRETSPGRNEQNNRRWRSHLAETIACAPERIRRGLGNARRSLSRLEGQKE